MVPQKLRSSLVAACLALVLVTSGCMTTGPVEDETVDDYAQQFEQEMNDLDGFTANRTTTVAFDGDTTTTTDRVWVRPSTGEMRAEAVAPDERAGDVVVRTTNASWHYDVSENRAHKLDFSESDMPSTNGFGYMLDDLVERSNVSYAGTEQVDGETTHRIELTPTDGVALGGNLTVWVDADTRFPVKLHQTVDTEELNVSTTIRYDDVELNPGIEADRFTFEPPANATVEETQLPPMERYQSLDALRENASMAVPDPALGDGFDLDRAVVTHLEAGDALSMTFSNGTTTVSVGKQDVGVYGNASLDGGETVTVGDAEGTYRTFAGTGVVQWTCDGHRYSVGGSLSKAALVDLAESVTCS
jgi:outer membrane lipoprotein-sorting protein